MNRRDALKSVTILMGATISMTTLGIITKGCNTISKKEVELFSSEQEKMIDELVDTILPETSSPGAKAAGVGPFVAMMIKDCYPEPIQKTFVQGLLDLEKRAESKYADAFVAINAQQRSLILQEVVDELKKKQAKGKEAADSGKRTSQKLSKKEPTFFQLAKELTMLGYFTSEIGAKQALEYLPIPGKYDGCIDLLPGQKAWAL